jgi:hypothetical protein
MRARFCYVGKPEKWRLVWCPENNWAKSSLSSSAKILLIAFRAAKKLTGHHTSTHLSGNRVQDPLAIPFKFPTTGKGGQWQAGSRC